MHERSEESIRGQAFHHARATSIRSEGAWSSCHDIAPASPRWSPLQVPLLGLLALTFIPVGLFVAFFLSVLVRAWFGA